MELEKPIETEQIRTDKVTIVSAGHGIHDTYQAFLPSLLPVLIQNFQLVKAEAGLLSVFAQVPSLLQPVFGYLADRKNLRNLVILAPAVTAIMMSFLGIAPSYLVAAFLLLIVGISSASIHAAGPVITGRLSANRLGLGMSFWMAAGELGRTLGPILIVTSITYLKPEGTPWLAVGGVLTSLFLYFSLREVNTRSLDGARTLPWKTALIAMRPLLIPLTGLVITRAFAFVSISTFLPTFMTEEGSNLFLAGASLSVMEAAGIAGAFFGGSLSDRFGRKPVMAIMLALTSVFIFLFLAVKGWVLFPVLLLLGFSLLSITPVIMALVQESFPENRSLANGIYMAINFLSSGAVTILIGAIGDLSSLRTAYMISGILVLVGLPFVFLLPKTTAARKN